MSDETREPATHDEAESLDRTEPAADGRQPELPDELVEDGDPDDDFDPAGFDPEDFAGGTYESAYGEDEDDVAAAVQDFWEVARPYAGMAKTGVVTGVLASETVPPPAWSFGADPEAADELLDLVLDGEKTATTSAAWDYEDAGEPLPQAGELSILLDGSGRPRALIRSTSVETVPFDEVDGDVVEDEAEGDGTVETWRAEREAFFRETLGEGREFAADMPILVERFEVLYPRP